MQCELCKRPGSPENPVLLTQEYDGRKLFKCKICRENKDILELPKRQFMKRFLQGK